MMLEKKANVAFFFCKIKHSVGGGIGDAALFGTLCTMIGCRVKEKTTSDGEWEVVFNM